MNYEFNTRNEYEEVRTCVPTYVPFEVRCHVLPGYAIEIDGQKFRPRWLQPIYTPRTGAGLMYFYNKDRSTDTFETWTEAQFYLVDELQERRAKGPVEIDGVIYQDTTIFAQRLSNQDDSYTDPGQQGFCQVGNQVYLVKRENADTYTVIKDVTNC